MMKALISVVLLSLLVAACGAHTQAIREQYDGRAFAMPDGQGFYVHLAAGAQFSRVEAETVARTMVPTTCMESSLSRSDYYPQPTYGLGEPGFWVIRFSCKEIRAAVPPR